MDVEILFPEINLFPDQTKVINSMKPPIISRSRRRRLNNRAKLRTLKKEVADEVAVYQRSDALPSDKGLFGSNRPGDTTALVTAPALADSVASEPPVVNLVDTPVVLAAVQPPISLIHYNLRPRVSRLP